VHLYNLLGKQLLVMEDFTISNTWGKAGLMIPFTVTHSPMKAVQHSWHHSLSDERPVGEQPFT
jgi:hypothetical protein